MKVGDKCWTISSSMESQSYGDYDAVEPMEVQILKDLDQVWLATGFCLGELDHDSNSKRFVPKDKAYLTEEEANRAYLQSLYDKHQELEEEIDSLADDIEIWEKKVEGRE